MSQDKVTPPFQYYHKIDENNLLFFGPNENQDKKGDVYYSYNIDIYDISKNQKRNIIQIVDPSKMKGMPSIYYANGLSIHYRQRAIREIHLICCRRHMLFRASIRHILLDCMIPMGI